MRWMLKQPGHWGTGRFAVSGVGRSSATGCVAARGAVLLETALMVPILLLVTFGMVEFGFYFFLSHQYQNAAREGARVGIIQGSTEQDIEDAVARTIGGTYVVSIDEVEVVTGEDGEGMPVVGRHLMVAVEADWAAVGIRPLRLMSADRKVRGATVMRKE